MDIHDLAHKFVDHDIAFTPPELHGFLTSHLNLDANLSSRIWLDAALKFLGVTSLPLDIEDALLDWYHTTAAQLSDTDMLFYPYVLEEDESVEEKVTSLAFWCQGYVVGFSSYGAKLKLKITDTIKEIILDLTKVSQIETDKHNSDDNNEAMYMEVLEYVRMAVMHIHYEYTQNLSEETVNNTELMH
jgi:uncharacterized protein